MDTATLRLWQAVLGALLAFNGLDFALTAWTTEVHRVPRSGLLSVLASPPALTLVVALCLFCYLRFARRAGSYVWGLASVGLLVLAFNLYLRAYSIGPGSDYFQTGAVVTAWVLGRAYARALGIRAERGEAEWTAASTYAATAAIAVFAATYVCAASSKLINSRLTWLETETIRLMVLSHFEVGVNGWADSLKMWIGHNPWAGLCLEIATLVTQGGAWVMMIGPRARMLWCTLLIGLHLSIRFTTQILFIEDIVMNMAFGYPWVALARRAGLLRPAPAAPPAVDLDPLRAQRVMKRVIGASVTILALLWLTPLGALLRPYGKPWAPVRPAVTNQAPP